MKSRTSRIVLLAAVLTLCIASVFTVAVFASGSIKTEGEMVDIKNDFASYLIQDTRRIDNDGYVGALQYTVYYDKTAGGEVVETGINGTPIIVYAINTNTERVGNDSNKTIITSMLERGYVVVVLDYLNNAAATGHELDDSAQYFVQRLKPGTYFDRGDGKIFPAKGGFDQVFVVPSGHNVLLDQTFWEIDKHSADGTLEKIVENWNTDFKGTKAERLVKWANGDTTDTRKTVAKATDGTSPVWYDASGTVDADGLYTKVKYTVANTITDCVKPDGSPLDMDMKLHLVYPTNPDVAVPLLSVSCCWGYATNTHMCYTDLCSHHTGALFRGYAGAVYDYLWQPMARDSAFGYYDGNLNTTGAVTGDHMNYSIHLYNDKLINTAAIRYLRYLALSDSKTYKLDTDAFCTIGLSKGGWFTFLGEKVLQSALVDKSAYSTTAAHEDAIDKALAAFTKDRIFYGHHGETRYQAGNTETISGGTYVGDFAISGGERQPWLTYNGTEIISGVQLTYAANGSQEEDISAGHAPMFSAAHMNDEYNAAYGSANTTYNLAKSLDIPLVFFEVDQLHEFAYYPDMYYSVETYDAFFDFANYYLKNEAVKVLYTDPSVNDGDISLTDKITVQFSGAVKADQASKIKITAGGKELSGSWELLFGGTQWIFTPESMTGATEYTITVDASIAGDNGVPMGSTYSSSFITEAADSFDASASVSAEGYEYTLTLPSLAPSGKDRFFFYFGVTNDAANVAKLYDKASGELLGQVNLRGNGSYEIDITDYVYKNLGKEVTLTLKAAKSVGVSTLMEKDFSTTDGITTYSKSPSAIVKLDSVGNESASGTDSALKVYIDSNKGQYGGGDAFYENVTGAIAIEKLLGSSNITKDDLGRKIEITIKFYDTVSRTINLHLNSMTHAASRVMDYDVPIYNVTTKAGEWMTLTVPYVVYDTDYGARSATTKTFYVAISPTGNTNMPIYFSDFKVKETVTDIVAVGGALIAKDLGGAEYKAPVSDTPISLYNGSTLVASYSSWKAALGAYVSGYTVKLNSDYTLTNDDVWGDFGTKADSFVIDLNGYTVYSENTANSLIWLKNTSKSIAKTNITLKNGGIVLDRTPIISYESSNSSGFGKAFGIKLEDLKITLAEGAMLTELITASSIPTTSGADVDITLDECDIDLGDEDKRASVMLTVLPEGKGTLDTDYTVKGGSLAMSHPRWITVQEKATYVDYVSGDGGNMKLYLPAPYAPSTKVSYIISEGYATYVANTTSDNVTEYILKTSGEGSTRYGIIPDAYLNAETYPFVLFKEGTFVGAYSTWNSALAAAQNTAGGAAALDTEVQLVLRRDYKNVSDPGPQINGLTNLVLDLGGFKFISEDVGLDFSASYAGAPYETSITVRNGKILSGRIAFVDGQLFAAAGGVKTYNLIFEGVTFGFDSALGDFWGDMLFTPWTNVASANGTDINITFDGCVFDLRAYPLTKGFTVFNASDANRVLNVNVNIVGGEILMDSAAYLTFAKLDSGDSLRVSADEDGNYVTLKATSGVAAIDTNFVDEDGKNRAFKLESDNGSEAVYTLVDNPLATDYGVITNAYADAEAYPFAVFKDGAFVAGYSSWNAATVAAQNQVSGTNNIGSVATILLRRDYGSYNKDTGSTINTATNIVFDLGENTFTCDWVGLDLSGNYGYAPYKTSVTVKNGTVLNTRGMGFVDIQHNSGEKTKEFEVTFDGVTFGFAPGATTDWNRIMLFEMWTTNAGNGSSTVATYNNCTFNLRDNVPSVITESNRMNIFPVSDGNKNANVHIRINGGNIIASNLNLYNIFTGDENDSIVWGKGSDGKYTTMTTPTTAAYANVHYTGAFNADDGVRYFIEMADDGTTSTYELGKMTFDGYGTISFNENKLLSAVDFPFVVFIDGAYKAGYGRWNHAINGAKGFVNTAGSENTTVNIVQRRDYNAIKAHDAGSNFNDARGKIVLDLMGYTITNVDNYFIDIYLNYSNANLLGYKSSIEIKNGTLLNARAGAPMIAIGHTGTNASYDTKQFGFTFTNVTFKVANGVGAIITEWTGDPHVGDGTDVEYFFDGCTFDFTGAASGATFFNCVNTVSDSSVVFKGGSIVADSFSGFTLYKANNEDVSYLMPDNGGRYMTLTQLAHVAAPTVTFKSSSGKVLSFAKESEDGLYATYVIGEPTSTKYGDIPYQYNSVNDYPFAVFDEKGNFIGAFSSLLDVVEPCNNEGAIHAAKVYMSANTWNGTTFGDNPRAAFILMRRSYKFTSIEDYHNLAQVQGIVTIDLNGYTLTAADNRVMFSSSIKPWSNAGDMAVYPTEFHFVGGKVQLVNRSMINFSAWMADGIDVSGKAFVYKYDDVDFEVIGSVSSVFTVYTKNSSTPDALANPELIFNNCTFNLERALSGTNLFDLGNGFINTKITVMGGEIIASANAFDVLADSDATSKLTFTKSEVGNYTALSLPVGAAAPSEEFDISDGRAVFVKISESDGYVTYRLRNVELAGIDFTPKMSLTLDSNLVMNVYIPKEGILRFTFDGKTYDNLDDIADKIVTVDGKEYYKLSLELEASVAAREVILSATVSAGESTATGKFTFSVIKYADKVLDGNNAIENKLVCDVLSYVRAAYAYFGTDDAEAISRIDALLGEGYDENNAPAFDGSEDVPTEGLLGAALVLDATPAIRFYISAGADASAYSFYIGDKELIAVEGSDSDGRYLELDVYAYAMCKTITYTVGDVSGSYHINSYYEFAKSQGDASLITLVERFARYCESASEYRDSVTEN